MPLCICVYGSPGREEVAGSKLIEVVWSTLLKLEKRLTEQRYAEDSDHLVVLN